MWLKVLAAGWPLLFCISPAAAHHSFAAFDLKKSFVVRVEVKEFLWSNPHPRVAMLALDEKGAPQEYVFEMASIAQDARAGWRKDSVKPGDLVTVQFHPYKDGSYGGQLVSAILADGGKLGPPPRDEFLSGFSGGAGGPGY
jgi:hypothetical protein